MVLLEVEKEENYAVGLFVERNSGSLDDDDNLASNSLIDEVIGCTIC